MHRQDNISVPKALDIINFKEGLSILKKLDTVKSLEQAKRIIEEFKKGVQQQRRKLAKIYHPDKGGNEEKFKQINDICDKLLTIELKPPQQQNRIIIIHSNTSNYTTSNTTSTYYWS